MFEAYSSLELPGSQVVVLLSSLMVRLDVRIELGFVEMTTWFISKGVGIASKCLGAEESVTLKLSLP